MRQIPINEEDIMLGDKPCKLQWLCREMNKGTVGADDHEFFNNLVMHFHTDGDPAFMDRLRIAWEKSGLNKQYALERYEPESLKGDVDVSIPVYTAIIEDIEEWSAAALKGQFIRALEGTYPSEKSRTPTEDTQDEANEESVEAAEEKIAQEDGEDEPIIDPHGIGHHELPDPNKGPEYDPHGIGLQEIPDNNEV